MGSAGETSQETRVQVQELTSVPGHASFLFPSTAVQRYHIHTTPHPSSHHNTGKMSAIVEEPEGYIEPLKVLITLHDNMDSMDAIGPLEVFAQAQHDPKNPGIIITIYSTRCSN